MAAFLEVGIFLKIYPPRILLFPHGQDHSLQLLGITAFLLHHCIAGITLNTYHGCKVCRSSTGSSCWAKILGKDFHKHVPGKSTFALKGV